MSPTPKPPRCSSRSSTTPCSSTTSPPGQLTLHADRGAPMKAKATALLLADLGVTKSHSRPYTSNDNPFSESCFKTLKYQPQFPKRFGCIEDAKIFCRSFFDWYNRDHHHAGIGLMTPDQVHYGQADAVHDARQEILDVAYAANPERFVKKSPKPPRKSQPPSGSIRRPKVLKYPSLNSNAGSRTFRILIAGAVAAALRLTVFQPPLVSVAEVTLGDVADEIEGTGIISAGVAADITAKISGRVEQVFVDDGDFVRQGEIAAQLDESDLRRQLGAALAQLAAAESHGRKVATSMDAGVTAGQTPRRELKGFTAL